MNSFFVCRNLVKIANQMYPIFREEGNFIKKNIEEGPLIVQPHWSRNENFQNSMFAVLSMLGPIRFRLYSIVSFHLGHEDDDDT